MIDTDKYAGHTPAPWNADDDGAGGNLHVDAGDVRLPINWVDAQLMADAPLLLEEVKATHAAMEKLEQAYLDNNLHFAKEIKRLREGIKDYLALHMPSRDELRKLIE